MSNNSNNLELAGGRIGPSHAEVEIEELETSLGRKNLLLGRTHSIYTNSIESA